MNVKRQLRKNTNINVKKWNPPQKKGKTEKNEQNKLSKQINEFVKMTKWLYKILQNEWKIGKTKKDR
jgi:hypothetical protein